MRDDRRERRPGQGVAIQDAAGWILRIGVFTSVAIMIAGLALSFMRGNLSVARVEDLRFSGSPTAFFHSLATGHGFAVIELGVLLLVVTPILRVATSMILFAVEERDWTYTAVTFLVLALTLLALLYLR